MWNVFVVFVFVIICRYFVCLVFATTILTYDIKCGQGNNFSVSCRFNYITDNKTLTPEYPNELQNLTSHITRLTLGISNLTTIPSDTFDLLPNLQVLIARADLRTITNRQFTNASKLAILDFGYNNQLTELEANLFIHVPTLESIDLSYNLITNIEDDAFHGLDKVKVLLLDANLLSKITNRTFAGVQNVETLGLSRNEIVELENDAFYGMGKVKTLYLNRNRIGKLQKMIFKELYSVERIYLSMNGISEIENGVFDGLIQLSFLELAFNRIKILPNLIFDGTPNLSNLYLSFNGIEVIERPFINLTRLTILDVSYNFLGYIDSDSFSNSTHLENLELRRCGLSELPQDLFIQQNQLKVLDLSENNLTVVDLQVFSSLKELRVLKLEADNLNELSNFTEIKRLMPDLEFLNLALNEIDCDSVIEMIEYFNNNTIEYEFGAEVDVECGLLPFESRALQAYQLSNAQFINANKLDK